jgi:hypothetical protein
LLEGFTPPAPSQPVHQAPTPQTPAQPPLEGFTSPATEQSGYPEASLPQASVRQPEEAPRDQDQMTFAKLIPQEATQQTAESPKAASTALEEKTEEKKGEDNFPPFAVGEFLRMFPEAKPE